ncbi:hypothetical protein E2C01_077636 [Portunus trituberculatus]|uniref:Uncharacterized protein n=1 Tax=Portunus trituberculatus TaxID=210409 RepID=A0A5B7IML3_PORTR|nr:hypothetical protein [Portunus trituberculatus]
MSSAVPFSPTQVTRARRVIRFAARTGTGAPGFATSVTGTMTVATALMRTPCSVT